MTTVRIALERCVLTILLLGLALPANASPQEEEQGWRARIAPYFWLTSVSGDLTLVGQDVPADTPLGDVLEALDASIMSHFEVSNGNWGVFLGQVYARMSTGFETGGPIKVSVDASLVLRVIESGGVVRLLDSRSKWSPDVSAIVGIRYWSQEFELQRGDRTPTRLGVDWLDPFLGVRASFHPSNRVEFDFRGDVGGFGISNDTSDISWNLWFNAAYHVSSTVSFWAGYRALYADFTEGENIGRYTYDATLHGPTLGIGFTF